MGREAEKEQVQAAIGPLCSHQAEPPNTNDRSIPPRHSPVLHWLTTSTPKEKQGFTPYATVSQTGRVLCRVEGGTREEKLQETYL